MSGWSIAIVGATGLVGETIRKVLEEREFPVKKLSLFASSKSAGKKVLFQGEELEVEPLRESSFKQVDLAFFSMGEECSREFVPIAVKAGAVVIDNSSAFRMEPNVPLVVPEVNPSDIDKHQGVIANPNCSTIQLVVVLKPLHDLARIRRVVVSTYQSVSGAGREAMEELLAQTESSLRGNPLKKSEIFPHSLSFNLIPQIDAFLSDGYTVEEAKVIRETRKILHEPQMRFTVTAVRVPVLIGHSESVNIETEEELSVEEARNILSGAEGIIVVDEPQDRKYPFPLGVEGRDEVFVGRIRKDESVPHGLNLWIVADNLRKGAATNAIQIGEKLVGRALDNSV